MDQQLIEALQEERLELQELLKSQGWGRLYEIVRQQLEARKLLVFSKLDSFDKVLEQEFVKGEIAMAETFLALPALMLDDASQQIGVDDETNG